MSSAQGTFVWYELMTTDMAAAAAFYGGVVGWTAQDSGMPGMNYTLFKLGEAGVAGLMATPQSALDMGAPPAWMGYVAVDDVDACAAAMGKDGAKVLHPPTDIPSVGRFAVIADPQGAAICLFKGQGDTPKVEPGAPGRIGWHDLYTSDLEAGFSFYAKHFGWTKDTAMPMGEMGIYQIFAIAGVPSGGMMTLPPGMPRPCWLYYFNTTGVDAAVERVKAGGGKLLSGPMEVPGEMWIIQCMDPQGAMFAMVGPR
jgi:predicted enzyme related to lactoylglutathione lyase